MSAWTAPLTFTSNQLVTPAELNTHWRDNELALMHPVGEREFAEVTAGSTTVETSLYTVKPVIPAGAVGTTGTFIADILGRNRQGGEQITWTWRMYLGDTLVVTFAQQGGNAIDSEGQFWLQIRIEAQGAANSQSIVVTGDTTAVQARIPSLVYATSAIDLGADRAFDVTLQADQTNSLNYAVKQFSKQYVGRN